MESVETQIAAWRAHVAKAPAVNGRDVDELETTFAARSTS